MAIAAFFAGGGVMRGSSPGTIPADGFSVDTTSRTEVLSFYNRYYNASESYAADIAWSGTLAGAASKSGTTSTVFKEDVRRRVNFYRALAGMPSDIVFDSSYNSMDQDAALMFAVNYQLSHEPSPSWTCFTTSGSMGASNSNAGLGSGIDTYGPAAVNGYMVDPSINNVAVRHRRWLLYSQQQTMGTGDIPPSTVTVSGSTYQNVSSNALWVTGTFKSVPLYKAVPWPNAGYFPMPLLTQRWSISYPNADFSKATVTMQKSGTSVGLNIVSGTSAADTGSGDNTLVWEPVGLPASIGADTTYTVAVSGVLISGTQTTFNYNVTLFDPKVLGATVVISGTNAPYTTGATYTFNSVPLADSYQLQVSTVDASPWTEGAEDSPAPQISASTTGTYALRQSAVVRTGSKAFQLAFPDNYFADQSFVITRTVVPSATSQLQFYDLMRFATSNASLSAQVSTDNGSTWTSVWTRSGTPSSDPNFGSSAAWDTSFLAASASLSAYAGQIINIRFLLHLTPFTSDYPLTSGGLTEYYGFFIDDITVTNAGQLMNPTTTTLSGTATSFRLNSTTAGGALVSGSTYALHLRPSVGTVWYAYTPLSYVTAQAPLTYATWVSSLYPSATGGPAADPNHDGISNGLAYAFGLNPLVHNALSALPQPTVTSGTLGLSFQQPDGVTGVTYTAEWSSNLVQWTTISDTGVSPMHVFTVSTTGQSRAFFRYKAIVGP